MKEEEIKEILEFVETVVEHNKPKDIIEKMYQALTQNLISAPGQIAIGLITSWMYAN